MLRSNVTKEQLDQAIDKVAALTTHQEDIARRIFSQLSPEQIKEENITVHSIFKTIQSLQHAIDAGAAKVLGYSGKNPYFDPEGVIDYRIDKALGLV